MNIIKTFRIALLICLINAGYFITANAQIMMTNDGGQLVIPSGGILVINGDLVNTSTGNEAIKLSGKIKLSGDFTNNAVSGNLLTATSGKVVLNGSSTQTIGGSHSIYFNMLELNNSGNGIIIDGETYVNDILTLTDGVIQTAAGKELIMQAGSSISGGSNDSHVDGPMKKTGNTDFTFPVGDAGYIEQIGIANFSTTETFTAQYFRTAAPNNTQYSGNLTAVSDVEYWNISPASGSPQINLVLTWNSGSFSGIGDPSSLMLAHQKANGTWEDVPYISHSGTASNGSITVGPITTYSNFTFGTDNNVDNPLPITLLSFDAVKNGSKVELLWKTSSELNNDYFTIEKSIDGQEWAEVGIQKGAGNSNVLLSYSMTDYTPFKGISYYRLKQTDFDGSATYSVIRRIQLLEHGVIRIYPNPTKNSIVIEGADVNYENILILNVLGQEVIRKVPKSNQDKNVFLDMSLLSNGVYIISVGAQLFKVVKY